MTLSEPLVRDRPAARMTGAPPALRLDSNEFRRNFNERCFVLHHDLANRPAFDLEPLVHLARQTAETRPRDMYYDEGNVAPGQRWATIARGSLGIDEAIRR